jgi:hypothetical protein
MERFVRVVADLAGALQIGMLWLLAIALLLATAWRWREVRR